MNVRLPPLASKEVVTQILDALQSRKYRLRDDGLGYVRDMLGWTQQGIIEEVILYLRDGKRLYHLPSNHPSDSKKFQGVLRLDNNIYVHFKIDPKKENQPWFLFLNFHNHNTGFAPLPE